MNLSEETGICRFCARRGRKKNLAKVSWLVNGDYNYLCPECLDKVIADMMKLEWNRKYGYNIEYPYK